MNSSVKPGTRPANPKFSSGPCAKRPGWSLAALKDAPVGRSHRAKIGKARLKEVIDRSRKILGVPDDYKIAIVPASDTGAVEMAMWSLLGARGVDVAAWENFGLEWVTDATKQLKLADLRVFTADYGKLPDFAQIDTDRDVVFTWNGTAGGVCVPNGDWIKADRKGLTICDATSAAFAMDLPWPKLDVVTYSWQKVMGGEAAHGMLVLSPRAVERLETYVPPWPLPKIFRLTKGGKLNEGIFEGETINTPSMIAVEDALDGLKWAEEIGGLKALIGRTRANFQAIEKWVAKTPWVDFLCREPAFRSPTSVCLVFKDPWFEALDLDARTKAAKKVASLLETEGVAFDIGSYRTAPPGLRIWAGATVETADVEKLLPWIEWAYAAVKAERQAAE